MVPGYGDSIQMQKAGIIEIGDLYDINKKDLGGDDIAVQIEMLLDDGTFQSGWRPPVSMTDAISGEGIDELIQNIWDHKEHVELSGLLEKKLENRFSYKIKELISLKIEKLISDNILSKIDTKEIINNVFEVGKFNIYHNIQTIFKNINLEIKDE